MSTTTLTFYLSIFGFLYLSFNKEYKDQNPDYESQGWVSYIADIIIYTVKGLFNLDSDTAWRMFYLWCLFCLPLIGLVYFFELIFKALVKLSE